jgi:5-methylcytosine-specific restriction endonuclease McrA
MMPFKDRTTRLAYMKKWRSENREQFLGNMKRWREQNRERFLSGMRQWRDQNPDRHSRVPIERRREYVRRRRARRMAATVAHFPEPPFADHCYLCGDTDLGRSDLHLDHVIPLSRGGPHTPDNVAWACATCNLRKGAKTLEEFLSASRDCDDGASPAA